MRNPWESKAANRIQKEVERLCKIEDAYKDRITRDLCKAHGIPWNDGYGSLVHCDCGHDDAFKAWVAVHGHTPQCSLELPNFLYKPTGFEVRWYKWIGRSMETKGPTPLIAEMLSTCLQDITARGHQRA